MNNNLNNKTVCVAGLGYVGLPLALAFSEHLTTIGFDMDAGTLIPMDPHHLVHRARGARAYHPQVILKGHGGCA